MLILNSTLQSALIALSAESADSDWCATRPPAAFDDSSASAQFVTILHWGEEVSHPVLRGDSIVIDRITKTQSVNLRPDP